MAQYISDFDAVDSNNEPDGSVGIYKGDDSMRNIQGAVKRTFPSLDGPVNLSSQHMNSSIQTLDIDGTTIAISTGDGTSVYTNYLQLPAADLSTVLQLSTGDSQLVDGLGAIEFRSPVTFNPSGGGSLNIDGSSVSANASALNVSSGSNTDIIGISATSSYDVSSIRVGVGTASYHNMIGHYDGSTQKTYGTKLFDNGSMQLWTGVHSGGTFTPYMQLDLESAPGRLQVMRMLVSSMPTSSVVSGELYNSGDGIVRIVQ